MVLNSGSLNRRIQILRQSTTPDGYGGSEVTWDNLGGPLYAARRDVSDSERLRAGAWDNKLVTRFTIRASAFSRGIRRTDKIVHEGTTYEISGIKEVQANRAFLELTAETEEPL
ncbi:phage head closure protein [Ruegeria pomeroyi]|nr:phage head closure protein [Ruegeria pomeroyi]